MAREGKNGKTYQSPAKPRAEELMDPDEPLYGGEPEENPLSVVEKMQDLIAAHVAGEICLNPVQLAFVDDVVGARCALRGQTMDQALQVLDTFTPQIQVAKPDPQKDAVSVDRVAWGKERFAWLWDQYRSKFGERADWMHFSLAWESFCVTEGKA